MRWTAELSMQNDSTKTKQMESFSEITSWYCAGIESEEQGVSRLFSTNAVVIAFNSATISYLDEHSSLSKLPA